MGSNLLLAFGAALVGFRLGNTAKKDGFLAAGANLAATALTGYAVYRIMYPVTEQLVKRTLGE